MARAPKELPLEPHPLYGQLARRPGRPYRRKLEESINRHGQLLPILITMDNYIIDGVLRHEIMGAGCEVKRLPLWVDGRGKYLKGIQVPGEDQLRQDWEECKAIMETLGRRQWLGASKPASNTSSLAIQNPVTPMGLPASNQAPKPASKKPSQEILLKAFARKARPVTAREIAGEIECLTFSSVKSAIFKMKKKGLLKFAGFVSSTGGEIGGRGASLYELAPRA